MRWQAGIRRLGWVALAVLAVAYPARAQAPAAWTVMLYWDADNDLEAASLVNLEQMIAAGSDARVNVLILCDRAENDNEDDGYSGEDVANIPAWHGAKLFRAEPGRLTQLADWGAVNMGDPVTVARLLQFGRKQFPAERYGLIFGDHGASWPGACVDESAEGDMLTLAKLAAGLKQGLAGQRLELVGFDCCLMGNLEVADALAPYAKTMVASEELEPANGWSYTPVLTKLKAQPAMDGERLGTIITDEYHGYFANAKDEGTRNAGFGATLSVLRLDALEPVVEAFKGLAAACCGRLEAGRGDWIKIARARSKAEEYGASGDPHESGSAVHDVINLADELRRQYPTGPVADACAEVITATRGVVAHAVRGKGRPNANGVSVFFAPDKAVLEEAQPDTYQDVPFATKSDWYGLLEQFTGAEAEDKTKPELAEIAAKVSNQQGEQEWTLTSQVKGDDIKEATFILAQPGEKTVTLLGQMPAQPDEDGNLKETWDGGWFTIEDGKQRFVCPISNLEEVDDAEDAYFAEVPAQLKRKNGKGFFDVTLYFYLDFAANDDGVTGELVYAYRDGRAGPTEIEVRAGDTIRPQYVEIDEQGEAKLTHAEDAANMLQVDNPDDLAVGYEKLQAGKYWVGFLVEDLAGNTNDETIEVEVQ